MKLSKMRYKGYSWLHNPKEIKITKEQLLKEQHIPYDTGYMQDLGSKSRVIEGIGQLYGDDCLDQYKALEKLQGEKGSGILSLPNMKPFYAYFKSIGLACDPTPKLVTYKFVFVEDNSGQNNFSRQIFHKVEKGETLWDIAYKYKVDIEKLVSLNPQIKRIDELCEGDSLRIC